MLWNTHGWEGTKPKMMQYETAYRDTLQYIIDLGFDYDNSKTVESFKMLVDEMVKVSREALDGKSAYNSFIPLSRCLEEIYNDGVRCCKQDWYEQLKGKAYSSSLAIKGTRAKEMRVIIKKRLEYWVEKLEEFKKEKI